MKILLIHQYFLEDNDFGASRWNEITKVWIEEGHDITVLAGMMHYNGTEKRAEYKGKWFKENYQHKVRVLRSHVSENYNSSFHGRLFAYFSFVFSSLWSGIFKTKEKYDVIIVTSPPLFVGITAYLLSRIKRVPFIFEIRDLWPESAIDTGVLNNKWIIKLALLFEKFIYEKASKIIVLTPAFKQILIEKKNLKESKIELIPNAADFALSDNLLATFDTNNFKKELDLEGKFIITYVGAHGVANHLDQILDVAEKMMNTNAYFLLIGEGMEKKRLIVESNKRKISNIKFIDAVSKKDVFKYILISDLGASVLKKVETFKTVYSNKTFDYMSCKKPIIMAIDGVSRKLVEDANAGTYVEPENPDEMVECILKYMKNPEIIYEQGESGYSFAKKNFDRQILAKKYILAIEKN
jgi:glycosyltransferase involved in cell wall biosynthesis